MKIVKRQSVLGNVSLNHSLPYSVIGVQCLLLGGVLFDPLYWQAACLLQRAGSLDDKNADHNKIARAVAALINQKVAIEPIDLNISQNDFTLDIEQRKIFFGFSAIKGLKVNAVEEIVRHRPFNSFEDFAERAKIDITSTVALIKAGAFLKFESREETIKKLMARRYSEKTKLNGQNLLMISRRGMWPETTEELILSKRVFAFTQYLRKHEYQLDERAKDFLDEIEYPYDEDEIDKTEWKMFYDAQMIPIKNYLIENQEELLNEINTSLKKEWMDKYFPHSEEAYGEIETMGINFAPHPLANVQGCVDFDSLPPEPRVSHSFMSKEGRRVNLFKLDIICGIAIAKEKDKGSLTLLTPSGPVDVSFRKEAFAVYDKQISQIIDGKKKVVERSWFNRGTALLIQGFRQEDRFIPKKYAKSPMKHTMYKILEVNADGKCAIQRARKAGIGENIDDE